MMKAQAALGGIAVVSLTLLVTRAVIDMLAAGSALTLATLTGTFFGALFFATFLELLKGRKDTRNGNSE